MGLLSRRREHPGRVLTASAERIDLTKPAPSTFTATGRRLAPWQVLAWQFRDAVGEVGYAQEFLANSVSRMRLFAGVIDDPSKPPIPIAGSSLSQYAEQCGTALDRLGVGRLGVGSLLERQAHNLGVPGECYLVGATAADGEEQWSIRSMDEVVPFDGRLAGGGRAEWGLVEKPLAAGASPADASITPLDPATSYVARMWKPHPQWGGLADSPMRRVIDPCETLLVLGRLERTLDRSRILNAGVALIPAEAETSQKDDAFTFDGFVDSMIRAAKTAIADENSVAGLVPVFAEVPSETIEKFRHWTFERKGDDKIAERTSRALARLAQGLNVPPEILTGVAQSNHWTAWQIDESTFTHHVEPVVILCVDAWTAVYLRPALLGLGVPAAVAQQVVVWYDPADLVTRPNQVQDAFTAGEHGAIGSEAIRRYGGFSDHDKPSRVDAVLFALKQLRGVDPALQKAALSLIDPIFDDVEISTAGGGGGSAPAAPAPARADSPPNDGAPPAEATAHWQRMAVHAALTAPRALTAGGPDEAKRLDRLSTRQLNVDRSLRDRLHGACEAAMQRAMERAGAKARTALRARDRRRAEALTNVPNDRLVARLVAAVGVEHLDTIGLTADALTGGSFDALEPTYEQWVAGAQADGVAIAQEIAGIPDGDPRLADTANAQAADRTAGWSILSAGLLGLLAARLYDPHPAAQPLGEADPSMTVPLGLIRRSLAVAGGVDLYSGGVNDWGGPARSGEGVRQIASGGRVTSLLVSAGAVATGYEWAYGVSRNPFEPHLRLDGVRFASYADDALRNSESFPPAEFLTPGDHDGCHCDARVLYPGVEPQGAVGQQANDRSDAIAEAASRVSTPEEYAELQAAIADPTVPVPYFPPRGRS